MMHNILVAYDGGEPARHALEAVAEIAKKFDSKVTVISVVPTRPGRFPVDPWDDATVHADELVQARDYLRQFGLEPELLETAGDPAREIERIANKGKFDAIVVGSRGLDAVTRVLQGSVSEHVATHAATPVLVVR